MRRKAALLLPCVLVLGSDGRVRAEDPPTYEYVMYDVGVVEPVAIDDAGRMLLNSDTNGPLPRSYVATLDAANLVQPTPVPQLPFGDGRVTGRAIGPNGVVVGIAHAGEFEAYRSGVGDGSFPYFRAFRAENGSSRDLGALDLDLAIGDDPDLVASEALAINASGVIVGQTRESPNATSYRAVVWRGDDLTVAGLSSLNSSATGINSAGKIVGWVRSGIFQKAKLWTDAGEFDIDVEGSFIATPTDINDKDQVCGVRTVGIYNHAFLSQLSGTTLASNVDLGMLPTGRDSRAAALNDDGLVVGWSSVEASPGLFDVRAARWKDGAPAENLNSLVDPESAGVLKDGLGRTRPWRLTQALAVNSHGEILCNGIAGFPGEEGPRAFLLRPKIDGLDVRPRIVSFGDVAAGDGGERTVVVTNGTSESLRIRLGKPKKPFSVAGETKFVLAAGASRDVVVRATMKDDGDAAGELVVSADRGEPVVATLSAKGVPPVRVSPASLDFETVWGKATQDVTLTNLTSRRVKATLSGLKKPFALLGAKTVVLEPQAVKTVQVEFAPTTPPQAHATLVVKPDVAKAATSSVELKGAGARTYLVAKITGEAAFRRGVGEFEALAEGAELSEEDELTTGVDSGAILIAPDGSTLELYDLTQIRIATILNSGGTRDAQLQLEVGRIKAKITPYKTIDAPFEVTTPAAAASVRGTTFDTLYDDATQTTTVRVSEGKVLVTPTNAALKKVLVAAGKQVRVAADSISPLEPYVP